MRVRDGQPAACRMKATWCVGFALRAYKGDQERVYLFGHALVCNACRCAVRLDNFMSMRVFIYVTNQAMANGWPPPRKNLTRLAFDHLTKGYTSV